MPFTYLRRFCPLSPSETFGTSKDMIGIVLSGYTVAALIFRPFSGYMVDSFQEKKVLMICFFVFFAFFLGYIAAGTLLMFAIVRTLHGAPFGAVTVANSTVAIDVLPPVAAATRDRFYGLVITWRWRLRHPLASISISTPMIFVAFLDCFWWWRLSD